MYLPVLFYDQRPMVPSRDCKSHRANDHYTGPLLLGYTYYVTPHLAICVGHNRYTAIAVDEELTFIRPPSHRRFHRAFRRSWQLKCTPPSCSLEHLSSTTFMVCLGNSNQLNLISSHCAFLIHPKRQLPSVNSRDLSNVTITFLSLPLEIANNEWKVVGESKSTRLLINDVQQSSSRMQREKWFLKYFKFECFGRFYLHLSRGFRSLTVFLRCPFCMCQYSESMLVFASLIVLT